MHCTLSALASRHSCGSRNSSCTQTGASNALHSNRCVQCTARPVCRANVLHFRSSGTNVSHALHANVLHARSSGINVPNALHPNGCTLGAAASTALVCLYQLFLPSYGVYQLFPHRPEWSNSCNRRGCHLFLHTNTPVSSCIPTLPAHNMPVSSNCYGTSTALMGYIAVILGCILLLDWLYCSVLLLGYIAV